MDALIKAVRKLPVALRRSLTWDRGSELTQHARFTVATDVKVFFCDPRALGKEAATRTPTDYFDSISRKGWIYRLSAKLSWIPLPGSSILDPERLWTGRLQPIFSNQVFRRPIEAE